MRKETILTRTSCWYSAWMSWAGEGVGAGAGTVSTFFTGSSGSFLAFTSATGRFAGFGASKQKIFMIKTSYTVIDAFHQCCRSETFSRIRIREISFRIRIRADPDPQLLIRNEFEVALLRKTDEFHNFAIKILKLEK
jgi:hypothetical protein